MKSWIRFLRRAAAALRAWRIARYRERENRARAMTGRVSIEGVRKAAHRHDDHIARLEAPPAEKAVSLDRWKAGRR
jgi:hypothetical protein